MTPLLLAVCPLPFSALASDGELSLCPYLVGGHKGWTPLVCSVASCPLQKNLPQCPLPGSNNPFLTSRHQSHNLGLGTVPMGTVTRSPWSMTTDCVHASSSRGSASCAELGPSAPRQAISPHACVSPHASYCHTSLSRPRGEFPAGAM